MKKSRRGFIEDTIKGTALLGLVPVALCHMEKGDALKMLTEEGKLVEIKAGHLKLKVQKRKASDQEVHDWIKLSK